MIVSFEPMEMSFIQLVLKIDQILHESLTCDT